MKREPWLYYNIDDDCYYAVEGKTCGAELAYAKRGWAPRSAINEGMETYRGRNAIRNVIRDVTRRGKYRGQKRTQYC